MIDCQTLQDALSVAEGGCWNITHVRDAAHLESIRREGFRVGTNPNILPGVYSQPEHWYDASVTAGRGPGLRFRLRPGTVILDTEAERPIRALQGMGHPAYHRFWSSVLRSMGASLAGVPSSAEDWDWFKANQSAIEGVIEGRRQEYIAAMTTALQRCSVEAVLQGGELVVLNTGAIVDVAPYSAVAALRASLT